MLPHGQHRICPAPMPFHVIRLAARRHRTARESPAPSDRPRWRLINRRQQAFTPPITARTAHHRPRTAHTTRHRPARRRAIIIPIPDLIILDPAHTTPPIKHGPALITLGSALNTLDGAPTTPNRLHSTRRQGLTTLFHGRSRPVSRSRTRSRSTCPSPGRRAVHPALGLPAPANVMAPRCLQRVVTPPQAEPTRRLAPFLP